MKDLIERLERATGPDSELDEAIALVLGWTHQKMRGDAKPYWRKPGVTEYYMRSIVPAYTASLDAALTLVPEGWMWDVSSSGCAWIMRNDDSICDSQIVIGGVKSPAIALCIAALRAREAAK